MAKQFFENTTKSPKTFYGVTLMPGEGKYVEVPDPAPAPQKVSAGVVTVLSSQLASLAYQGAGVVVLVQDSPGAATTLATWDGTKYAAPVSGGGFVSSTPYASSAALEAAYPAASNDGKQGLVGASSPYTIYVSTGGAWTSTGATTTIAALSQAATTLTTSATPTDATFTAFASQACTALVITNDTRVPIEYQRGGAGNVVTILPGATKTVHGITNANQVAIRRSDYAVANRTEPTTVYSQAVTRSDTYTLASTLSTAVSGGGWTTLTNTACTSVEINNNTGKDILYRINAGTQYTLQHGRSAVVVGITNANQVSTKAVDSVARQLRNIETEAWTAGPGSTTLSPGRAETLSAEAQILNGEFNYQDQLPAGSILPLGNLRTVQRLRKKGAIPLARFMNVAGITTNRAADMADVSTGEIAWGSTILEYTQTQTAAVNIAPAAALSAGIDVTNGSIHFTHVWPDNAGNSFAVNSPTAFSLELHSAGSPGAPTANFHTIALSSLFQECIRASASGYNWLRTYSISSSAFTASGTGANLSAITWARVVIAGGAGSNGCKLRPVSIEFVPNAMTKGSVIFTFDDLHFGAWDNVLPLLQKYNYPGVLFMDTTVKMGQTNYLTPSQIAQLYRNYGWQIVYQVYKTETGFNLSPEAWMLQASKHVLAMNMLGIHETQDGSYGSGTVTNVDDERYLAAKRMFRTMVRFNSGQNASPPFKAAETVPFGDPHSIRRLNLTSGFTAGTFYDRYKDHVDQAVAAKGVAIFGAHSEFNAAGENLTALASLVDYIRTLELAGTCQVVTMAGLIRQAYELT